MLNGHFEPGDLVTRGDQDIWIVTEVSPANGFIKVRCTKAPATGWAKVGDVEADAVQYYTIWRRE